MLHLFQWSRQRSSELSVKRPDFITSTIPASASSHELSETAPTHSTSINDVCDIVQSMLPSLSRVYGESVFHARLEVEP